jgi:hypothetical protein
MESSGRDTEKMERWVTRMGMDGAKNLSGGGARRNRRWQLRRAWLTTISGTAGRVKANAASVASERM